MGGNKSYLQQKQSENVANKTMVTQVKIVAIWVTALIDFFYQFLFLSFIFFSCIFTFLVHLFSCKVTLLVACNIPIFHFLKSIINK